MANNYLQFSEIIPHLSNEEAKWCEDRLDHLRSLFAGKLNPDETDPVLRPLPEDEPYDTDGCLFEGSVSLQPHKDWGQHLWLYAEEGCEPETLALFVQEFLRRFRPLGSFRFSWSATCSKPRVGAFGGGAGFVTAEQIEYFATGAWLDERQAAWHSRTG
jgi:hypothetical protein